MQRVTEIHKATKALAPTALCCVTNNSTMRPIIVHNGENIAPELLSPAGSRRASSQDIFSPGSRKGSGSPEMKGSMARRSAVYAPRGPVSGVPASATNGKSNAKDVFNLYSNNLVITKVASAGVEFPVEKVKELVTWLQVSMTVRIIYGQILCNSSLVLVCSL